MKQILRNNIMVREYEAEEWSSICPDKIVGHFYYDTDGDFLFTVWDDKEDVIIQVSTAKSC